ncbi:MAG: hypothetical protein JSW00_06610 [Thermoplasmata archaeon]|nr:MAG: hypothetical protein JSW00_06610 [Thermoplasmata archaeon]
MGNSKKCACLNLSPIFGILLIVISFSIFALGNEEQKAAKQQEKEKLTEIKQKIKAISTNECFDKYLSILNVEDDSSMYHITISLYPMFEPRSHDQIQTWTDAVCKSSKRILDNYGLVSNISVWAIRPILISVAGNGGLIVYGRTLYDRHTDRYEFKSPKVLKQ